MLFCRHDFNLIKEIITESEAEQLFRMGLKPNYGTSLKKKCIMIFKCIKCKKIKKLEMVY